MASVILLRHGETALNKKVGASTEKIRGWVDVPLDKNGQRQALELGVKYGNQPISKVYSTDFQRGRIVAEHIARTAHAAGNPIPLVATDALRPWNLGILHGKDVAKVLPVMNKCVENPDVQVPDGESFNDYKERYLPFLSGLLREAANSRGNIVAVTHSRNLQLARAWDKGGRDGTNFDMDRMLDYRDEVPPGQHIELKP